MIIMLARYHVASLVLTLVIITLILKCVDTQAGNGECREIHCPKDCGPNAHCVEFDNCTLSCRCNDGSVGTPPNCTELNCTGVESCGPNGICRLDGDQNRICGQCTDGYNGNGDFCDRYNCSPQCNVDEYCDDGVCTCQDGLRKPNSTCLSTMSLTTSNDEVAATTIRNTILSKENSEMTISSMSTTTRSEESTTTNRRSVIALNTTGTPNIFDTTLTYEDDTPAGDVLSTIISTTSPTTFTSEGATTNPIEGNETFSMMIIYAIGGGVLLLCLICSLALCVILTRRKPRKGTQTSRDDVGQITSESMNHATQDGVDSYEMDKYAANEVSVLGKSVLLRPEEDEETIYNPSYQSFNSSGEERKETSAQMRDAVAHANPKHDRDFSANKSYEISEINPRCDEPRDRKVDEEYFYAKVDSKDADKRSKVRSDFTYDIPDGELISKESPGGRSQPVNVKGHIYSPVMSKNKNAKIGKRGSKFTDSDAITRNEGGIYQGAVYNIVYEDCDSNVQENGDAAPYHYVDNENNGQDGGSMKGLTTDIYDSV